MSPNPSSVTNRWTTVALPNMATKAARKVAPASADADLPPNFRSKAVVLGKDFQKAIGNGGFPNYAGFSVGGTMPPPLLPRRSVSQGPDTGNSVSLDGLVEWAQKGGAPIKPSPVRQTQTGSQQGQATISHAQQVAQRYPLTLAGLTARPASASALTLKPGETPEAMNLRVTQSLEREALAYNRNPKHRKADTRMAVVQRKVNDTLIPSTITGSAAQLNRWMSINHNAGFLPVTGQDLTQVGVSPSWVMNADTSPLW
jgi:hypothetical protein